MKARASQASYAKRSESLIPYDAALITARSEQLIEAQLALMKALWLGEGKHDSF